jgi:hypothetical protein
LSFEPHDKLKKRTINLPRCIAEQRTEKTSRSNDFDNPHVRFCNPVQIRKMDVESYDRFQPDQATRVLIMWFHIPEAQEIVLRAITLSAHSVPKERLLLRQITNSIKSMRASVSQASLSYHEVGAFSLASSRRSYGSIGLWLSRAMVMARRLGHRVFLATALLGTGLTPTLAAELISPLDGFQATLGPVAVSIYYEPIHTEYQVVITASAEEPDSVIRFVSNLAPGQGVVVSVPRGVGQPARELKLHRVGDKLELERSSNND